MKPDLPHTSARRYKEVRSDACSFYAGSPSVAGIRWSHVASRAAVQLLILPRSLLRARDSRTSEALADGRRDLAGADGCGVNVVLRHHLVILLPGQHGVLLFRPGRLCRDAVLRVHLQCAASSHGRLSSLASGESEPWRGAGEQPTLAGAAPGLRASPAASHGWGELPGSRSRPKATWCATRRPPTREPGPKTFCLPTDHARQRQLAVLTHSTSNTSLKLAGPGRRASHTQ